MKRFLIIALVLVLALPAAFAFSNQQKIYSVTETVYDEISSLYLLSGGHALPSSSGPWSAAELNLMLAKIDRSSLDEQGARLYDKVYATLNEEPNRVWKDGVAMQFTASFALQAKYHANDVSFIDEQDWIHGYENNRPFAKLDWETWATDYFYADFVPFLAYGLGVDYGKSAGNVIYKQAFTTNIPLTVGVLPDLNLSFPDKGIASAGSDHWNLAGGRDKLSWGAGLTGNLMLGEQYLYHSFVRFNTFFDSFKYSLVTSFFNPDSNASEVHQNYAASGIKLLMAHRVEFRLFNDAVGFTINEAIMYQSAEGVFDLRAVNPFGFFHNEYIRANANSLLVFEADWAFFKGMDLYAQAAVDDFPFGEPIEPASGANPNAYGLLFGLKGAFALGPGILNAGLEVAKTDPFLYLREKYDPATRKYGVGYHALLRKWTGGGIAYIDDYTGYKYGGDALVYGAHVDYGTAGLFNVAVDFTLINHGVIRIDSVWSCYHGTEEVPTSPSTSNPFDPAETGAVERTTIFSISAEYQIIEDLKADLMADFVSIQNAGNVLDASKSDIQLSFAVTYTLD